MNAKKISSVRVVRWILDFILYTGGTMTVVSIVLLLFVGSPGQGYWSKSPWPVTMRFGAGHSLVLADANPHEPLFNKEWYVSVMPMRAMLMIMHNKNVVIILFDVAWYLLLYGMMFMIAYNMRKIFINMESGDFFDEKTPIRLRMIGWTIIIMSLLRSLLTYLYGLYTASLINNFPTIVAKTGADSFTKPVQVITGPLIDIPFEQLFIGITIIALAMAFQKGLNLKQEQALTV